jgi:hypothetical protein
LEFIESAYAQEHGGNREAGPHGTDRKHDPERILNGDNERLIGLLPTMSSTIRALAPHSMRSRPNSMDSMAMSSGDARSTASGFCII